MKRTWIAAALCFACAPVVGAEQQTVSAVVAALERAKSALMQAYAVRGKAFPKTSEWQYRSDSSDAPSIAYNSRSPTTASLVADITGTKNADLDGRHLALFATSRSDGTVVWICGTARSALRTEPSEEKSMYPYLPPECRN
ncbi:MAG: pilin [Burkholderiaceae bacterium]|nr:pilin [Burkholderiaceae bacterium]